MARRGGWNRSPTGFSDVVKSDVNKRLRATALQALSGVIERSPVDSGAFRGNNMVSVGSPDDGYDLAKTDKNGSAALGEGMTIIGRVRDAFSVIYVSNNLPYAERLEEGSSSQAPAGIYGVTFNSLVERSR
ncbi:MAG TPA: hypothetical protein VFM75_11385 [Modicisalibacter sp.]|nr:hypothetical protein [Modicisalibacter sp.]